MILCHFVPWNTLCSLLELATGPPLVTHARHLGLKRHLRREIFQKADIHTDILCSLILERGRAQIRQN